MLAGQVSHQVNVQICTSVVDGADKLMAVLLRNSRPTFRVSSRTRSMQLKMHQWRMVLAGCRHWHLWDLPTVAGHTRNVGYLSVTGNSGITTKLS